MKIISRVVAIVCGLLVVFFSALDCYAVENGFPNYQLATVAGDLRIAQKDKIPMSRKFSISLRGEVILSTDGDADVGVFSSFPVPKVLKVFKENVGPFDEVVVLQQFDWGNACNGGPIWFLGLSKNGAFNISKSIDFCGGEGPVVQLREQRIIVTIPADSVSQKEVWVYEAGTVSKKQ